MRCLLLLTLTLFTGCAALQQGRTADQEKKLREAGFQSVVADTPAHQTTLRSIPPYTLQESKGGLYRYADPTRNTLWVGNRASFERYNQLVTMTHSRRAGNLAEMTSSNGSVIGPLIW